jgi:hypothetical protein
LEKGQQSISNFGMKGKAAIKGNPGKNHAGHCHAKGLFPVYGQWLN